MVVLVAAVAAGCFMTGLLMVTLGARHHHLPLDLLVSELHRPWSLSTRRARVSAHWLSTAPLVSGGVRKQDLEVCDLSAAAWLSRRLTWSMFGVAPGFVAFLLSRAGLWSVVPPWVTLVSIPAGVICGWFYSVVDLRSDADEARKRLRHAIASYLELVTILMAGGAGPESAMFDAADVGEGAALHHIRSALASARVRQEDPWTGLGRIGKNMDVSELIELEATMKLAADGAKVKSSLTIKADSIRERAMAQLESEAEAKSETMVLPVVLMFAGFMILLGYPAIAGLSMS